MKTLKVLITLAVVSVLAACNSASSLKKAVEDNPDIVFAAIEKNPKKFIEVVNKAAREAQNSAREDEMKQEQDRLEEEFKSPKTPVIAKEHVIMGNEKAPITIVEYSDFECPYCARGYATIKEVMKNYGDKVRVIYKHKPLDFHPLAEPAARYYEAIAKQDKAKAIKFHDELFTNQGEMKTGKDKYFKKVAGKVGANVAQVMKDLDSEYVNGRIKADSEEADKFGFQGTPGFLINGVSLRGAYPFEDFKKIIDRHLGQTDAQK